ncbi:MAG: macro domain-containing protein [Phycisphaerae bacterium]
MNVIVTHGDILDVEADTLICSANVFLNLSGGVGGAIRMKHGDQVADRIQSALHAHLQDRGLRHVNRGEIVVTTAAGTNFARIVHAVAVDGMYESSVPEITRVVTLSLERAASLGAKRVALTALATGYGRLTLEQFAEGATSALTRSFALDTLTIWVRHADEAERIERVFRRATPPHPSPTTE